MNFFPIHIKYIQILFVTSRRKKLSYLLVEEKKCYNFDISIWWAHVDLSKHPTDSLYQWFTKNNFQIKIKQSTTLCA